MLFSFLAFVFSGIYIGVAKKKLDVALGKELTNINMCLQF